MVTENATLDIMLTMASSKHGCDGKNSHTRKINIPSHILLGFCGSVCVCVLHISINKHIFINTAKPLLKKHSYIDAGLLVYKVLFVASFSQHDFLQSVFMHIRKCKRDTSGNTGVSVRGHLQRRQKLLEDRL